MALFTQWLTILV